MNHKGANARRVLISITVALLILGITLLFPAWVVSKGSGFLHGFWDAVPHLSYGDALGVVMVVWGAIILAMMVRHRKPGSGPTTVEVVTGESNYTGWNRPLMVTLTATSNPYLADQLPLRGRLSVFEMGTDGYAMRKNVAFQKIDDHGRPVGASVMVDNAEFTYTLPPDTTR